MLQCYHQKRTTSFEKEVDLPQGPGRARLKNRRRETGLDLGFKNDKKSYQPSVLNCLTLTFKVKRGIKNITK